MFAVFIYYYTNNDEYVYSVASDKRITSGHTEDKEHCETTASMYAFLDVLLCLNLSHFGFYVMSIILNW